VRRTLTSACRYRSTTSGVRTHSWGEILGILHSALWRKTIAAFLGDVRLASACSRFRWAPCFLPGSPLSCQCWRCFRCFSMRFPWASGLWSRAFRYKVDSWLPQSDNVRTTSPVCATRVTGSHGDQRILRRGLRVPRGGLTHMAANCGLDSCDVHTPFLSFRPTSVQLRAELSGAFGS